MSVDQVTMIKENFALVLVFAEQLAGGAAAGDKFLPHAAGAGQRRLYSPGLFGAGLCCFSVASMNKPSHPALCRCGSYQLYTVQARYESCAVLAAALCQTDKLPPALSTMLKVILVADGACFTQAAAATLWLHEHHLPPVCKAAYLLSAFPSKSE